MTVVVLGARFGTGLVPTGGASPALYADTLGLDWFYDDGQTDEQTQHTGCGQRATKSYIDERVSRPIPTSIMAPRRR